MLLRLARSRKWFRQEVKSQGRGEPSASAYLTGEDEARRSSCASTFTSTHFHTPYLYRYSTGTLGGPVKSRSRFFNNFFFFVSRPRPSSNPLQRQCLRLQQLLVRHLFSRDKMFREKLIIVVPLALGLLGLYVTNACNEAVCASIVSKCMLTQSCKCDSMNNATCSRDCFYCLDYLYTECCSCVGKSFHLAQLDKVIT